MKYERHDILEIKNLYTEKLRNVSSIDPVDRQTNKENAKLQRQFEIVLESLNFYLNADKFRPSYEGANRLFKELNSNGYYVRPKYESFEVYYFSNATGMNCGYGKPNTWEGFPVYYTLITNEEIFNKK